MKIKNTTIHILLGLLIIALSIRNCNLNRHNYVSHNEGQIKEHQALNRNPTHINYTKHAKCRMECRHIDESEIKDILANGSINYKKAICIMMTVIIAMLWKGIARINSISELLLHLVTVKQLSSPALTLKTSGNVIVVIAIRKSTSPL